MAHAYVSQRPADGYTLLTFTGTQIATIVRGKSAFKSIDDLKQAPGLDAAKDVRTSGPILVVRGATR